MAAFSHHHHHHQQQQQFITSPADHLLLTSPPSDASFSDNHFQYQYSAGLVDSDLVFNDPPFGCFQDLIDPTSNCTGGAGVQDTFSCNDQATQPPAPPVFDDSSHPPSSGTDDQLSCLTVKQMYAHGCGHQRGLKRKPSRPSPNSVNCKNVRGGKKQRKRNYSKLSGIKAGNDDDNKEEMKTGNCPPPRVASCREISPSTGYIHVRARRGQATDSHSLAERVRREKISERMKVLEALVPGCQKVTGKAMILDEIINYVQSLQTQVEFLSMKMVSLSPVVYSYSGTIGMDQDSAPSTMLSQDQLPILEQCNSSHASVVVKSPSFFLN